MFILPLDAVSLADVEVVGRKAAVAGKLRARGFPVPAGVCLTVPAFRAALEPLADEIRAVLSAADLGAAGHPDSTHLVDDVLPKLNLPSDLLDDLWISTATLRDGQERLAVRSSAVDEDSESSRAGMYTSVLGVRGKDALGAAVLACWRSYFAAHVLPPDHRHVFDDLAGMGILIQPMIEAECGGVCYSLDPVRPESGQVVISAAWGLTAGVVDGTSPVDTTWISRDELKITERRIVEKCCRVVAGPNSTLTIAPVTRAQRRAAVLPADWAIRVAQFGLAAEAFLGEAQDVEWAIAAERFWLLQSRPIVSLPDTFLRRCVPVNWNSEEEGRHLWLRSQPSGRAQDALLPLELDEIVQVEAMREETCQLLGAERNQRLKVVNGRIYTTEAPPPFSPGDGRIRRQAWRDLEQRLAEQGLTGWDFWGPEIVRTTERLAAFDIAGADGAELAQHLEDALAARRRHYMLHPLCSKQPPGDSFVHVVKRAGELPDSEAKTVAYQLLGSEGSVLTRLVDEIYQLARQAQGNLALEQLVVEAPPALWRRLGEIPGSGRFRDSLERLISVYGDRNGSGYGSEATVATPIWRERPEEILRLVAAFLPAGTPSPEEGRQRAGVERAARIAELCSSANAEIAAEFRRLHSQACRLTAHLEEHNHFIDQLGVGQLRRAVLACASWLVDHGALAERDDIFWLHFDEILAMLRTPDVVAIQEHISARRLDHEAWTALVAPPVLGLPAAELPGRLPLVDEAPPDDGRPGHRLTGQGASTGQGRGRARVALDPARLPKLEPGDVLVAPNVGPLWTLYVPILAGLVLDTGGLGQHAAAVAREYHIPAVFGTGRATRHIPDGSQVVVDGSAGTVEIVGQDELDRSSP